MNNSPISTNPNAVGEVAGGIAGLAKKAIGLFSGDNKSRTQEFGDSSSLHKLVLDHQAAEHSHAASESDKQRKHELDFHDRTVQTAKSLGYNSSSSMSLQTSSGNKMTFGGNKPVETKSAASTKPKSPVPTPPLSRGSKSTKAAAPITQGKYGPVKTTNTKPIRVRKGK
jgi:hypothetical protein